ncbi:MAG: AAA family ATPase [Gammaproteobacteria bacterium]|nr:AAA family ATPase [Gammaproteobacteria bacterium]
MTVEEQTTLAPSALRWACPQEALEFTSTAEVDPIAGIVGQPLALEALRFGLETRAPGQNVYVRGLTGTGRMSMLERLLSDMEPPCNERFDRCYVHNFSEPDSPRLITLRAGQARLLRRQLRDLSQFLAKELPEALDAAPIAAERGTLQERTSKQVSEVVAPFEAELAEANLALVQLRSGQAPQMAIFPVANGQALSPEQFEELCNSGQITPEQRAQILENIQRYAQRLPELSRAIARVARGTTEELNSLHEASIKDLLQPALDNIRTEYDSDALTLFLDELLEDVIEQIQGQGQIPDAEIRYGINILLEQEDGSECPTVIERTPSVRNLLGTVEAQMAPNGAMSSDYRSVRGGALLRADGGYLILDAADVLTEPGSWRMLMRTLRSGRLDIVPADLAHPFAPISLKPESVAINVKVILVGDAGVYYQLEQLDRDFSELFKVLADFDSEVERSVASVLEYAGVLARMVRDEGILHFDQSAVATLAEHGARIAASSGKLTARFGRVADIAREAEFIARRSGNEMVSGADVTETVRRTKSRASLPSLRFQSFIKSGSIRIQTTDEVVGQINGLAVMSAGPVSYGFPARITATVGPGRAGIIDIESRADMSGSIHTKGFHILGGLLRYLIGTDHPMTFTASLAFEQSYGGIDGDSASGAETCCLLSALTQIPIRQSVGMTGAIDQHGHIQSIGGVNEKVEGFYDICNHFGLTGDQGVIIPASNAGDLMLRPDVVAAAQAGKFRIFAVDTIHQALEILMRRPAGTRGNDGEYEAGTILHAAVERVGQYWRETLRAPTED